MRKTDDIRHEISAEVRLCGHEKNSVFIDIKLGAFVLHPVVNLAAILGLRYLSMGGALTKNISGLLLRA